MEMVEADIGKPLRRDAIEWEASRNQALHQKYRKILYHEKIELDRMKAAIDPLRKAKREFYDGKTEKPSPLLLEKEKKNIVSSESKGKNDRVIKTELMFWVDNDPDVIAALELVSKQAEKVEYLKDTLDDIRRRTFSQGIILNSQKFKHGLDSLGQVIDMRDPDWES